MTIATEWVKYGAGKDLGYLARPVSPGGADSPLPSIVVLQEIWGVDVHMQDVTRRFAAAGYVAIAPDLYANAGARPEALSERRVAASQAFMSGLPQPAWFDPAARAAAMASKPATEQAELEGTFNALFGAFASGGLKLEAWLPQVRAAVTYLREECAASKGQKVGSIGFCMGGGLSSLLACADPDLGAAVVCYGSAPPEGEVKNIRCPILGLYGSKDERVNASIPGFVASMKAAGKSFEHHVYEGAQHAFFNDNRPAYHAVATRDAFLRSLSLFQKQLT